MMVFMLDTDTSTVGFRLWRDYSSVWAGGAAGGGLAGDLGPSGSGAVNLSAASPLRRDGLFPPASPPAGAHSSASGGAPGRLGHRL